mgnify:FL=1
MEKYEIVPMSAQHIDDVAEIEKLCFSDPWSREMFAEELANSSAHYCVCLAEGVTVGYAGYWCVIDEGDITNVAVHPKYRRRGIGAALMEHMLREAEERKMVFLSLEVRVSNEPAIALYERYGFERVGVRKRYYSDNGEDAAVMMKRR